MHDRASLEGLRERYDAVNIKLDKTGGLTEALAMADAARAQGFEIMVGCMVVDLAGDGAGDVARATSPLRRPRRSAPAGARPRWRVALRRQPDLSAGRRALGVTMEVSPCQPHHDSARQRHGRHDVIDALPVAGVDRPGQDRRA